jgi:hypothetical protein
MNADEKLKAYKENSKICAFCKNESFFDGVTIQLISLTESGEVVPHSNKDTGMSAMLPMCAYHMVLSQEGLMAITTENRVVQSKFLTQYEPQSTAELTHLEHRLRRMPKNPFNIALRQSVKAILSARRFHSEMTKSMEEAKEKVKSEE